MSHESASLISQLILYITLCLPARFAAVTTRLLSINWFASTQSASPLWALLSAVPKRELYWPLPTLSIRFTRSDIPVNLKFLYTRWTVNWFFVCCVRGRFDLNTVCNRYVRNLPPLAPPKHNNSETILYSTLCPCMSSCEVYIVCVGGLHLSYLYNTHLHPIPPSSRQSSWFPLWTGGFHKLQSNMTVCYMKCEYH